jgi:hypothetical protein
MSTAHDHDQVQSNEPDKSDDVIVNDLPPNGASAMAVATNKPSSIPQHVEDHPTNGVGTPGANDTPPPHLISQSAPLATKAEQELDDEDATDTKRGHDGVESETDSEEDEEEEEEDDDDDDDDDDEPALKYERFGGAFQDLLKKDSASALAVSTRFLVRAAITRVAISADNLYAGAGLAQWVCAYLGLDGPKNQDLQASCRVRHRCLLRQHS